MEEYFKEKDGQDFVSLQVGRELQQKKRRMIRQQIWVFVRLGALILCGTLVNSFCACSSVQTWPPESMCRIQKRIQNRSIVVKLTEPNLKAQLGRRFLAKELVSN